MVPVLCYFRERSYFGFGFGIMKALFSGVNIMDCKEIQYLALSSSITRYHTIQVFRALVHFLATLGKKFS
jgi:hypothetical protein